MPAPSAAAPASSVQERPAAKPARRESSAADKEAAKRRRRIKALEEKIASLEAEVEGIETRLWEEALTLGPVAAHELATRRTSMKEELDRLVEDWARLSEEPQAAEEKTS